MPSYRQLKAVAMESLKGNWKSALLITLLSIILGVYAFGPAPSLVVTFDEIQSNPAVLLDFKTAYRLDWTALRSCLFFLLGAPALISVCCAYQSLVAGSEFTWRAAFCRWSTMYKAIGMRTLRLLITAVGLFLIIFPGILAHYTFCMSSWIMAENPNIGIRGAMDKSRSLMHGHKMELFFLDLSFSPWLFLSIATVGLGFFFYSPYHRATRAAYFKALTDHQ